MGNGETVGTRALVEQAKARTYCQAKSQSGFAAEQFGSLKTPELDSLNQSVDAATAKKQTSRYRLEMADLFCLRRDLRYGLRSRRWLFAKGEQTKLNTAYAAWNAFIMENLDHASFLKTLPPKSVQDLVNLKFDSVIKGT